MSHNRRLVPSGVRLDAVYDARCGGGQPARRLRLYRSLSLLDVRDDDRRAGAGETQGDRAPASGAAGPSDDHDVRLDVIL